MMSLIDMYCLRLEYTLLFVIFFVILFGFPLFLPLLKLLKSYRSLAIFFTSTPVFLLQLGDLLLFFLKSFFLFHNIYLQVAQHLLQTSNLLSQLGDFVTAPLLCQFVFRFQ